jgi:hypothetical protein
MLQMYAHLSTAAQAFGSPQHATEFSHRGLAVAAQLFETADEGVAEAMHTLGYFFFRAGDLARAGILNRIFLSMCESLELPAVSAELWEHGMLHRAALAAISSVRLSTVTI